MFTEDQTVSGYLDKHLPDLESLQKIPALLEQVSARVEEQKKSGGGTGAGKTAAAKAASDAQAQVQQLCDGAKEAQQKMGSLLEKNEDVLGKLRPLVARRESLLQAKQFLAEVLESKAQLEWARQVTTAKQVADADAEADAALQTLMRLKQRCPASCAQLNATLAALSDSVLGHFKSQYTKQYGESLNALEWPKRAPGPSDAQQLGEFKLHLSRLIRLQIAAQPDLVVRFGSADDAAPAPASPASMWAMDLLVTPIRKRFNYHFSGRELPGGCNN